MNPQHRNIVHGKPPYEEPKHWSHGTLQYQRKMYGRFGSASKVDPSLCWPTKEELKDKREYERIAFPYTIPQMAEEAKKKKLQKELEIKERQEMIVKKIAKLDVWTKDLMNRIAKKEADAKAAKVYHYFPHFHQFTDIN